MLLVIIDIAGWSSLAARVAHNHEVVGSNPTPATRYPENLTYNVNRDKTQDEFTSFFAYRIQFEGYENLAG